MEFSAHALAIRLQEWPAPNRYVALVSGGGDSMVLLHALATVRSRLSAPLAVLHFEHGLATASGEWARFVEAQVRVLGLPFFCEALGLEAGAAAETRAREARYARLTEWMQPGDCCLTAHHADDQAETFLLQALRGSGVAGLAAMPARTDFGSGWLARPLLGWTRDELGAWATGHNLDWIEDPANQDRAVPRNWLRTHIWPALAEHWPAAARTLGRAACLAGDAAAVLSELAAEDLHRLQADDAGSLAVEPLHAFSAPRRRNAVRHWLHELGLPVPTAQKLLELDAGFIVKDPGGGAIMAWPGACMRRYRNRLFAFPPRSPVPATEWRLMPGETLDLGELGRITLRRDARGALTESLTSHELKIRFRTGGERVCLPGKAHHRRLKHLLQEQAVLPWMRDRLPLLYAEDELVAVPGVVEVSAGFVGTGWRLDWSGAPPLH